jgi:hypothetical protein
MKKLIPRAASLVRPLLIICVGLMLALFSAALTYSAPPAMDESFGGAAFFLQSTSTPQPKDISEIGSTDGIVIMAFLIALIVIIPILWRRKAWMEPR